MQEGKLQLLPHVDETSAGQLQFCSPAQFQCNEKYSREEGNLVPAFAYTPVSGAE